MPNGSAKAARAEYQEGLALMKSSLQGRPLNTEQGARSHGGWRWKMAGVGGEVPGEGAHEGMQDQRDRTA